MAGSSSSVELEYIFKNKSTVLLHGGHQYCAKTKNKNGSVLWECTQRKKNKCTGSITIQEQKIINEKHHNICEPDFAKNEIAVRLAKLKEKISNPKGPGISTAYNSAVSSLKDTGIDVIRAFPRLNNIKATLYKHRNTALGVNKTEFEDVAQVEIPKTQQDFLLADYNDGTIRVIAFCSESAHHFMNTLNFFLGDGTFWTCTKPFYQLYTIHGDLGSTNNDINILPLVYVLMSHKSQRAYEILFGVLKSQLPEWQPKFFKCDFEEAAINAMRNTFEDVSVTGCYVHYRDAIWRKGKQLGLTKQKLTKRQVALSAVLPMLPQEKILQGWFYVASQSPDDEKSKQFRTYMLKQWLKDDYIKIWCTFDEQHRTNNLVEAWNGKIKKRIVKKNPSLIRLLTVLSEDASFYNIRAKNFYDIGESITKRSQKSIDHDQFIMEVQKELINGDITIGHFLEKLR